MRSSALTTLLAIVVFLNGCENRPSDGAFSNDNQKPPTGAWIPYDDQGPLSAAEEKALNAVKRDVRTSGRRGLSDYHYRVRSEGAEHHVMIFFGSGYIGERPVLTPGGHATWVVDDSGKIVTIHPGA